MALAKYSDEQIQKMSMIELANIILTDEKNELNFLDLFMKVAELKKFTQAQKDDLLAQFYTDLNMDGRFSATGSNNWGLKRWYPVEQTSEKALAESRKKDAEDEEDIEYDDDLSDEETEDEEDVDDDFEKEDDE